MKQVAIAAPVLAIFGCASTPEPLPQLPQTEAAIAAAETVGATQHPKAALHLKLAKDQLRAAQSLLNKDEEEKAQMTLERARQDAELALALAREQQVREQAREATQKVEQLGRVQ